jgi:hypothetical protein
MGEIIFAVAVRISVMATIEPEFRSTGRYKLELQNIHRRMLDFGRAVRQAVQQTRPFETRDLSAFYLPSRSGTLAVIAS